ncbi:MAG: c-type cytochrome [Candidatus Marinimicrobia bacterium]|nr:c-type cytochrome [Candidatus Neomarinimicrobiota bacterium]
MSNHNKTSYSLTIIAIVGIILFTCAQPEISKEPLSIETGELPRSLSPLSYVESSPPLLAVGKILYDKKCAPCHGLDGAGEGAAAYLLYPKPRDFVAARYRMVSTWERVPTDDDIFGTVSRGIPGSSMPSWAHLTENERWSLVHYIKSFANEPIEPNVVVGDSGVGMLRIPPEAEYTLERARLASERFRDACASCHGTTGEGDGVTDQIDEKGMPTRPRDLTMGVFKGNPDPKEVYRRIVLGMPGTPMPMSDWSYGEEAWHLTHFILEMSSEEQREIAEMKKFRIVANRVEKIPEHPDAGIWREAGSINIHMMPLWWRVDRPEILTVQALHDGKELSLRLTWTDATDDHTAIRVQDFRDAAAVQFSAENDPPFFGMGEKTQTVTIWMWKSERQADLEPAFQDIDKMYPNLGIDSYPNLMKSALEQPARNALTLESDPDFITGWGAGNIVSDPTRKSAVENLTATGFGTLKARPIIEQNVQSFGVYDIGTYRVVFRRSMKGEGQNSMDFVPGQHLSVAFSVWNGSAGDRDGKKSVTIWQDLVIAY